MPVIGCRLMPPRVSQHQGYEEHGLRLTPVSRWILRTGIRTPAQLSSTRTPWAPRTNPGWFRLRGSGWSTRYDRI